MKHSETIESEAKDSEALEFLVDGGTVPATIRIPANLNYMRNLLVTGKVQKVFSKTVDETDDSIN